MLQTSPTIRYAELSLETPSKSAFERFLAALDGKMSEPTLFGWFHWLCILLTVAVCVFVALKCRKLSGKQVRLTVGITAAVLLVFELYKQLNYSYYADTDVWSYNWSAFPFQFCSTPMYIMAMAAVWKEGKFQTRLYDFLATYGLFAGVLVLAYPASVFTATTGINIQTMVHHCSMIVIGVFLYATGQSKIEKRTVWRAAPVFLVLLALALVMNGVYAAVGDPNQNFNMFYLSLNGKTPLAFLDTLFEIIPYPIIVAGYAAGFTLAGFLMTLSAKLCSRLYQRLGKRPAQTAEDVATLETEKNTTF